MARTLLHSLTTTITISAPEVPPSSTVGVKVILLSMFFQLRVGPTLLVQQWTLGQEHPQWGLYAPCSQVQPTTMHKQLQCPARGTAIRHFVGLHGHLTPVRLPPSAQPVSLPFCLSWFRPPGPLWSCFLYELHFTHLPLPLCSPATLTIFQALGLALCPVSSRSSCCRLCLECSPFCPPPSTSLDDSHSSWCGRGAFLTPASLRLTLN